MSAQTSSPISWQRWMQHHGQKLFVVLLWASLFLAYRWYTAQYQLGPLETMQHLIEFMQNSPYGPLIYILLYTIRPLLLFPASLITIAGGFVYGPIWGVLYSIIASNASASVAFVVGRFFGQNVFHDDATTLIQRYAQRLRAYSFETVLTMRLSFLPFDLIGYITGFLHIRWEPYVLATAIGSLPSIVAIVLFGASITDFDGVVPTFNPWVLVVSFLLLCSCMVISRVLRRREQQHGPAVAAQQ
ncbi:MAG: hypothetical protein Fur005_25710 [Roseiflexaceae bacterium]